MSRKKPTQPAIILYNGKFYRPAGKRAPEKGELPYVLSECGFEDVPGQEREY